MTIGFGVVKSATRNARPPSSNRVGRGAGEERPSVAPHAAAPTAAAANSQLRNAPIHRPKLPLTMPAITGNDREALARTGAARSVRIGVAAKS